MPQWECRRRGLYQASIQSKTARANWRRVVQRCSSRSSSWRVPKKLSATELSKQSPMDPIEPSSPALRSRRPKAQLVYCAPWSEWATVWPGGRPPTPDGHLHRVDDELAAHVVGDGPADDPATE